MNRDKSKETMSFLDSYLQTIKERQNDELGVEELSEEEVKKSWLLANQQDYEKQIENATIYQGSLIKFSLNLAAFGVGYCSLFTLGLWQALAYSAVVSSLSFVPKNRLLPTILASLSLITLCGVNFHFGARNREQTNIAVAQIDPRISSTIAGQDLLIGLGIFGGAVAIGNTLIFRSTKNTKETQYDRFLGE